MNKLAELKAAAEAAMDANEAHWYQKDWQAFSKAANPATILKLVAVCEAAQTMLIDFDAPNRHAFNFSMPELRDALKELNDD